jgi:hypothetical protein
MTLITPRFKPWMMIASDIGYLSLVALYNTDDEVNSDLQGFFATKTNVPVEEIPTAAAQERREQIATTRDVSLMRYFVE